MYHIIINPASRSGRGAKIWAEQVEPALKAGNTEYQTYFSGKAGEVRQLAAQITAEHAAEPDLTLIVLGGDGTINETLQGIADPSKVILGYIPTGSSNDLARDLGISKDPKAALNLILHNNTPRAMDLGRLTYLDEDQPEESRLFAVSCGIGFDAAVCAEAMSSRIKDTMNWIGLGKLTYLGIGSLFRRQYFQGIGSAGPAHCLFRQTLFCQRHQCPYRHTDVHNSFRSSVGAYRRRSDKKEPRFPGGMSPRCHPDDHTLNRFNTL